MDCVYSKKNAASKCILHIYSTYTNCTFCGRKSQAFHFICTTIKSKTKAKSTGVNITRPWTPGTYISYLISKWPMQCEGKDGADQNAAEYIYQKTSRVDLDFLRNHRWWVPSNLVSLFALKATALYLTYYLCIIWWSRYWSHYLHSSSSSIPKVQWQKKDIDKDNKDSLVPHLQLVHHLLVKILKPLSPILFIINSQSAKTKTKTKAKTKTKTKTILCVPHFPLVRHPELVEVLVSFDLVKVIKKIK